MLSGCYIRTLLLVFFVYRVAAQWPLPTQSPFQYRWLNGGADDWWRRTRPPPRQTPLAGSANGNTLAATEIIAEVLEAVRSSYDNDDDENNNNNVLPTLGWFRLWVKKHRQRQQQQKQRQQYRLGSGASPKVDIQIVKQGSGNGNGIENDVDSYETMSADWTRHFATPPSIRLNNVKRGVAAEKRSPLPIGDYSVGHADPHYPYALVELSDGPSLSPSRQRTALRNYKRERSEAASKEKAFTPSISSGAMTNLGTFFKDLTKNVRFTEQSQLGESQQKLLAGVVHPFKTLHEEIARDHETMTSTNKTAAFLHAIRSYRPSQKIRSLVSMNPKGYHGSQFIDPNYMWMGLGK